MAIVINEFEVAPEAGNPATQVAPVAAPAQDLTDLAQKLAQLEERELRLEAN